MKNQFFLEDIFWLNQSHFPLRLFPSYDRGCKNTFLNLVFWILFHGEHFQDHLRSPSDFASNGFSEIFRHIFQHWDDCSACIFSSSWFNFSNFDLLTFTFSKDNKACFRLPGNNSISFPVTISFFLVNYFRSFRNHYPIRNFGGSFPLYLQPFFTFILRSYQITYELPRLIINIKINWFMICMKVRKFCIYVSCNLFWRPVISDKFRYEFSNFSIFQTILLPWWN